MCTCITARRIVGTSPASRTSMLCVVSLYSVSWCLQFRGVFSCWLYVLCVQCWGRQECCLIVLISLVCLVVIIILFSVDPNFFHTYSIAFLKIFSITSSAAECIMRFIACLWSGLLSTCLKLGSRAASASPATAPPQPFPDWSKRHPLSCDTLYGSH